MMTSLPSIIPCFHIADYYPKKEKFSSIKVNGYPSFSKSKIHEVLLSHKKGGVSTRIRAYTTEKNPATMLTKPQNYDEHLHGEITEEDGYKQIVAIRAFEVGPDKTATIQTIFNLLQDAAMCHIFFSGLVDGEFCTRGMRRHNLAWVVSRMQVEVDHYPAWGEIVEIKTWIGAIGRTKIRRDWVIQTHASGVVLATATSTRVVIDTKTKRVSKIPDEVRAEISPFLVEKHALKEYTSGKIEKLNDNAKYASYNMEPMWSDLDVNYHVNNVHYIKWILEDAAMCHIFFSGLVDGEFCTRGMRRHNLAWVVSRMQVEVDHYPAWGEIVEIKTWIGAIGRTKIRRDWVIQTHASGVVLATATSTRVVIDTKTKRVSKIPDEVRAEISPFLVEKHALKEYTSGKIEKLNDNAKYASYNMEPMWSDLDVNYHVNNVHYIKWILEPLPQEIMKDHQISSMVLEYKRECRTSDIVQSLCEPQEDAIVACSKGEPFKCVHLLQIQGDTDTKSGDIVRARTLWKRKMSTTPCST